MPTISEGTANSITYWNYRVWSRSPRLPDGTLDLKTLPVTVRYAYHREMKGRNYNTWTCTQGNPAYQLLNNNSGDWANAISSLYADTRKKFVRKAWSDAQASIAVDIAERKQTISMIAASTMRLYRAAVFVRRGSYKNAAKALSLDSVPRNIRLRDVPSDVFAQNWLAYRYGWLPLYGSIYSLIQALDKPVQPMFVKSTSVKQYDTSILTDYRTINYQSVPCTEITHKGKVRVTLKGQTVVSNATAATLQQYGLANPLLVAWELVPFSFVADWFLPVGDYLEQMTDMLGLTLKEFSHTSGAECLTTHEGLRNYSTWKVGDKNVTWFKGKTRTTPSTLPIASFPLFSMGLNPTRALDAISLYRAVILGKGVV